jgi:predicted nucleic acid-binding protein
MSGKLKQLPSYYFDACVYLAYLRNETAHYGKSRIGAIESIWKQSERGGVVVVTSAITITEVLSHKLEAKAEKKFSQIIQSGVHQCEDVTPPIASKARQYRDYYHANPVKLPGGTGSRSDLTTPDAIHLATAIILSCEQFLTFDGVSENKDTIGLLWLSNKVATETLIITQPQQVQGEFAEI